MKTAWSLIKETIQDWSEDKASRLAASLAYYTMFSIAPLLVIIIAIAGLALGKQAAQGQIVNQIEGLMGQQGAQMIQTMIQSTSKPSTSIIATIIGVVTLLLGASGVFGALQDSLNTIWGVTAKPGAGIKHTIRQRFLSFGMVLGVGFLLLVSLVLSAGLAALGKFVGGLFPGAQILAQILNFVISFAFITLLFAMMYKVLPDVKIAWGDVWIGAAATSLLFTIGKFLIGLYLGRGSVGSAYGAAGSLVVVLIWIYYSAQILFLGAEFTQVYARRYGSMIEPAEDAVPVTQEARAEQGAPTRERVQSAATGRPDQPSDKAPAGPAVENPQQAESASRKPGRPRGRAAAPAGAGATAEQDHEAPEKDKRRQRERSRAEQPAAGQQPGPGGLRGYALGFAGFMLAMIAFAVRGGPHPPEGGSRG